MKLLLILLVLLLIMIGGRERGLAERGRKEGDLKDEIDLWNNQC